MENQIAWKEPSEDTTVFENEEILTFEEWAAKGRRIHKGQKSVALPPDGLPRFRRSQTYDPTAQARMSSRLGVTGPWDDTPH